MKNVLFILALLLVGVAESKEKKHLSDFESWENRPRDEFGKGKEAFELVKEKLLQKYIEAGISEDELYRAAVKGMLEGIDPRMSEWNRLISPTERKELEGDLTGEIVGAGLEIKFDSDSGMAEVIFVVPESPAEVAGVKAGDRVLSVDGKFYKGKQFRDMVYDIRGKTGESRKLALLRQDKVVSKTLKLQKIPFANIDKTLLSDNVGLLSIRYFTGNTTTQIREALEFFQKKKIKGLVIDMRSNKGGLFNEATLSTGLFLPKGKSIVRVTRRDKEQETISAKDEPLFQSVPLVLLVNEETSSGAEVFVAALKEGLSATVVGTPTKGKWSIQTIDELPNKFAAKYTIGMMFPPSGANLSGKGVTPDVELVVDPQSVGKLQHRDPEKRLEEDAQLRTALGLIKEKI